MNALDQVTIAINVKILVSNFTARQLTNVKYQPQSFHCELEVWRADKRVDCCRCNTKDLTIYDRYILRIADRQAFRRGKIRRNNWAGMNRKTTF
ncbi:hypothetical protein Trydic_g20550 [Trypoxylus dichotomus]